jgi:PAS domain-containing serine/threonine kinase
MIKALDVLHNENGKAHCDVKPDNYVITDNLELAIIDFGCSCDLYTPQTYLVGTEMYKAPEIGKGNTYIPIYTDQFSLGVSMFTVLFGGEPWEKMSSKDYCFRAMIDNDFDKFFFRCNRGQGKPIDVL